MTSWYGILAPRGVSSAVVAPFSEVVAAAQTSGSVSDALASEGAELPRLTPRQYEEFLKAETALCRAEPQAQSAPGIAGVRIPTGTLARIKKG